MMKQSDVFDVLMYLFEHYMDDGPEFSPDQQMLRHELVEVGFPKGEINKAFAWLEGLTTERAGEFVPAGVTAIRHYADVEGRKLDAECRGFLLFLEQSGVLDAHARELVIERIMALDLEEIRLAQLKWIVLMVLFNLPGQDRAYTFLEDLVYEEVQGHLH